MNACKRSEHDPQKRIVVGSHLGRAIAPGRAGGVRQPIHTETIVWFSPAGLPDAELTVLASLQGTSEATWPVWHDGEQWIDATTAMPLDCIVTAWTDMPEGYLPPDASSRG